MKSKIAHKIIRYSSITLISIIAVAILLLLIIDLAIRPQNVQNLVERYSKEYINAEVQTDTIEIHLFRNFPNVSLSVKDCIIKSLAFEALDSTSRTLIPEKADSLAKIGELNISLSLVDLFFSKLNITGIELESPQIYGYVSQFGINNWDIIKQDSTKSEDSTSFMVNIKKISIKDGAKITLRSVPDSSDLDFSLNELFVKGTLCNDISENYISKARLSRLVLSANHFNKVIIDSSLDNSVKLSVDSLNIKKKNNSNKVSVDIRTRTDMTFHGINLADNVPFDLKGGITFNDLDDEKLEMDLDNLTLYAATLPVTMNGSLILTSDGIEFPHLKGIVDNYNIKNILKYIPEQILTPESIETDAAITLQANVKGKYQFTTGALPNIDLSLSIPSSKLKFNDKKRNRSDSLQNLETSISLHFDKNDPKSNTLNISKLIVDGNGILIDVTGKIEEYTKDPLIDIKAQSKFNLDLLSNIIPMNITSHGSAEGNILFKGRASNLNLFSLSKNEIEGKVISNSLLLKMPELGVDFNCGKTSLYAGIQENGIDTTVFKEDKILNFNLSLDTLYLNYKDSIKIAGSKVTMAACQDPPKDTPDNNLLISPKLKINGNLNIGGLYITTQDSTKIRLRKAENSFSLAPWTDGTTPVFTFQTGAKGFSLVQSGSRFAARNSDIALKIIAHTPKRDTVITDSTKKRSFDSKRFTREVFRNWNIAGNIQSSEGRIITPSFPLKTRFSKFNLSISNDRLDLQNTKLNLGNSSITISGQLQGLIKAVTEHDKLIFNGSVIADSLDINQIMQAFSNSKEISMADGRSDETIETAMEKTMDADTSEMKAPIIPEFLESNIELDLKNVSFKKTKLQTIKGNLIAKNSIFQLNKFNITTEFGKIDLDAFYAAKKIDDISLGFDMKMNKFEVEDLIEFIPNVDSLLPMMRSFRGEITCTLSAMTKMDSLLNINFETVNGVGALEGNNVILLDGQTFTEIAKALKFKNKDKNYIDKISLQCVASDNKIEIFPFVLQIDRYKAAVSGTQNLDMSFKYHISLLKSPIPFRVGLNITGTTDNMKFKIGKCLYKNEDVPVYSQVIDSARINLGKQIKGVFMNGVEKAISNGSTKELAKVAEKEQEKTSDMETLSDSERQKLDSGNEESNK